MNYSLLDNRRGSTTDAQQQYQSCLSCAYRSDVTPVAKVACIRKAMHIVDDFPMMGNINNVSVDEQTSNISHQSNFLPNKDILSLFSQFCQPSSVRPSQSESAVLFRHFLAADLLSKSGASWDDHLSAFDSLAMLKVNTAPSCFSISSSSTKMKISSLEKYPSLRFKSDEPLAPINNNHTNPSVIPVTNKAQQAASAESSVSGFVSAAEQLKQDISSGRVPPSVTRGLRKPINPTTPAQPTMNNVIASTHKHNGQKDAPKDNEEDPFPECLLNPDGTIPSQLEGLEPKLLAQVAMEILDSKGKGTDWSEIAGLEHAKSSVDEAIVWPLMNPELFTGLRDPPRGLLLFGPPGTGKTMIARAIASRAGCTFLNISASSLMSKWVGEGEKLVRCMFAVASVKQPTVVFIDEIDSLLSARSEGEMEVTRRVKTEFLVQMDGVGTDRSDRILLIGATNRPEELDEAARRRMEKRLYIPLPDIQSRTELIRRLIDTHTNELTPDEYAAIGVETDGYSGADIKSLAREAAMGPVRDVRLKVGNVVGKDITTLSSKDVRPVSFKDCKIALKRIKPSVGSAELVRYDNWNEKFGSFPMTQDKDEED